MTPWLIRESASAEPGIRLFCFPHAGSGTSAYTGWELPGLPSAEVWSVELPGRGKHRAEQPLRRVEQVIGPLPENLAPLLDRPFALFGHSMGAILAFELARLLRRTGGPMPAHLFLSGYRAPDVPRRRPPISKLEDDGFLERLAAIAGPSSTALRDRRMLLRLAPTIRADLELCETYTYRPEPPLTVPLTCLAAADDPEFTPDEVALWARQSSRDCALHVFTGGHLYLLDQRDQVLALIARELATVLGEGDGPGESVAAARRRPHRQVREQQQGCAAYWPVDSRYCATIAAGTRPRSLISMPRSLAHARTTVVSIPLTAAVRAAPRAPRRPLTLRACSINGPSDSRNAALWRELRSIS
jgi:medium-chain acyl-[acyl-carrier-protein] hydrolase